MSEPVPPSEIASAPCAGRCRRLTPHRVAARRPDAWDVRCLACDQAHRLWVLHAAAGRSTACGLPLAPPLRSAGPAGVSCPDCLLRGARPLGAASPALRLHCAARCRDGRVSHAGELWADPAGDQLLRLTCQGCGVAAFWGGTYHRAGEGGLPRCGAPTRPYYRLAAHRRVPHSAACHRCAELEAAARLVPDWRPLNAIPEDFYAA